LNHLAGRTVTKDCFIVTCNYFGPCQLNTIDFLFTFNYATGKAIGRMRNKLKLYNGPTHDKVLMVS
jgi:hypothetical protein